MALGPTDLQLMRNESIADAVEEIMDKHLREATKLLDAVDHWHNIKIEIIGSCLPHNIREILIQRYKKAGWHVVQFYPRITTTEILFQR